MTKRERTAYIGLGSNLGDRSQILQSALDAMGEREGIQIVAVSRFIETAPVGPLPQGPYINAAARLRTTLTPRDLLQRCLEIEAVAGRSREDEPRWGPRTLDLDLLLFEDRIVDEPGLSIPHPRMTERLFVPEPLAEIAADLVHPRLHCTVESLRAALVQGAGAE